jgi:hypothetical protein
MLPVGRAQDLAFEGPGGTQQPFKVKTGHHVLKLSVAVVALRLRVKNLIARRQNDRPHPYVYRLLFLMKIDGFVLANSSANGAFVALKVKAAFRVYIGDQRNGLREINVDGLIQRQVLIIFILDHDWAVLNTGTGTRTFFLFNVSGLLDQGDVEFTCFSFYPVHFSVGEDLYVGMPADLDQFGRKYSDGAVIGGKGLVQLGHMAANGRCLVDQINLKTRCSKVKRSLNTADPSTHHHHISSMTVRGTLIELFFNSFFFHFSMS